MINNDSIDAPGRSAPLLAAASTVDKEYLIAQTGAQTIKENLIVPFAEAMSALNHVRTVAPMSYGRDPRDVLCAFINLAAAPVQAQEPVAYIWSVNGMVKTGGDSIFDDREKFYSAPVQPVAVPDGPSAEDYSDMLRDFFFRHAAGGYNDEGGLVPLETAKDKLEWIVNEAIQHAAPAAQGDAVKLECCGSTEFCERAACPAQGDAKELTDDEIVQAVRSVGVDTHPSKFGFIDEQIQGMSVTVLRQVIAAIAAKAAS